MKYKEAGCTPHIAKEGVEFKDMVQKPLTSILEMYNSG